MHCNLRLPDNVPVILCTVTTSDHVRVLDVIFSSDLRLDKHVSSVCAARFYCFANFDELDGHWTSPQIHLFTLLSQLG